MRDPGCGIRDAGSGMGKNQDPGSGINILDPQHCFFVQEEDPDVLIRPRIRFAGS
jgi:hypothetical protein